MGEFKFRNADGQSMPHCVLAAPDEFFMLLIELHVLS
jgi:hypothetical protein